MITWDRRVERLFGREKVCGFSQIWDLCKVWLNARLFQEL